MNEIAELIIELEINGSEPQRISYVYKKNTLSDLDSKTLNYVSEEDYFLQNKEMIKNELIKKRGSYGLKLDTIDINLKEIYIQKKHKKTSALFQNYITKDHHHLTCILPLTVLAKNRLRNGFAILLYHFDKEARQIDGYQAIFADFPTELQEQLEMGKITDEGIEKLWQLLERDTNFKIILRYIVSIENPEEMQKEFQNFVILRTKQTKVDKMGIKRERVI